MSHEIETFDDGTAAFFSARETAWHQLGTVTPDCLTAEDAMRVAQLDWTVSKHPLTATATDYDLTLDGVTEKRVTVPVPDKFATMRRHPKTGEWHPLGVVGADYAVVQNIENAAFLNALVDPQLWGDIDSPSGAPVFETAGALRGGRSTFVTMRVPSALDMPNDPHELYMIALNSHDGSRAFQLLISPVRVVCANTQAMALRQATNQISIRHTRNARARIDEAKHALGFTVRYARAFEQTMLQLFSTPVSEKDFGHVVDKLWTPTITKKGEPSKQGADRKLKLVQIFTGSETCEYGRYTAYGALNAITEYTDWYAPVSGATLTRAERIATGALDGIKDRALRLLLPA